MRGLTIYDVTRIENCHFLATWIMTSACSNKKVVLLLVPHQSNFEYFPDFRLRPDLSRFDTEMQFLLSIVVVVVIVTDAVVIRTSSSVH